MATVFAPEGGLRDLEQHFDNIPHFLFRTYSPVSQGHNEQSRISSMAVVNGCDSSDVLTRPREDVRAMIEKHLRWWYSHDDNLVSWTSSFIFAVQLAIYRHYSDKDGSETDKIYICVLDTRELPPGSFLPANALLEEYDIPSEGKLKHEYYCNEFLSQGSLVTMSPISERVSLASLVERGLYKLHRPFNDFGSRVLLYRRVEELLFFCRESTYAPAILRPRVWETIARRIAVECFVLPSFQVLMLAMLQSLHMRIEFDASIVSTFGGQYWNISHVASVLEPRAMSDNGPADRTQCMKLLHDVHSILQQFALPQFQPISISNAGSLSTDGIADANTLAHSLSQMSLSTKTHQSTTNAPMINSFASPQENKSRNLIRWGSWTTIYCDEYFLLIRNCHTERPPSKDSPAHFRAYQLLLNKAKLREMHSKSEQLAGTHLSPPEFCEVDGENCVVATFGPTVIRWNLETIEARCPGYKCRTFGSVREAQDNMKSLLLLED